jgi:SSS family transporter
MNALDYIVIVLYLSGLIGFGFLFRNQSSEKDYFLGGRQLGWFPLSLSVMATQLSAISFVSAPAFVGLRDGGGLKWLTYELAVPLAMLFVMFVIAPALYRSGHFSIYAFLEDRFGRSTRLLVSGFFQIVRGFATGMMVYAMAIILEAVMGIPYWQSVVVVGVVTLLYSAMGGMKAVVWGDAIQMCLIFGGLIAVAIFALYDVGGVNAFVDQVDRSRLLTIDWDSFGFSGDEFGFWPMLFGGFVLYASYYGCDQSQAQRVLSAQNLSSVRRLLLANGLMRFPIVILYCLVGLVVGVSVVNDPALMSSIPADRPDFMLPIYILERLPNGVIGLLIVALLSAAMSSVSSAINSLAAVSLDDLQTTGILKRDEAKVMNRARTTSILWGIAILGVSFFGGQIAPTVIEGINKIGSALYGPVLGVFALAILLPRTNPMGVNIGLVSGLAVNLLMWNFAPQVFWMWWNLIGLVVTCSLALATTAVLGLKESRVGPVINTAGDATARDRGTIIAILCAAFLAMLLISLGFNMIAGANLS